MRRVRVRSYRRRGGVVVRHHDRSLNRAGHILSRKQLATMMFPWQTEKNGVGHVASFYVNDRVYPDKTIVERALRSLEADDRIAKIPGNSGGWGPSEVKELRRIIPSLRHYLQHDYESHNHAAPRKGTYSPYTYDLESVKLNSGGYDSHGRYFGTGARLFLADPIFVAEGHKPHYGEPQEVYVRARDAKHARQKLDAQKRWGDVSQTG